MMDVDRLMTELNNEQLVIYFIQWAEGSIMSILCCSTWIIQVGTKARHLTPPIHMNNVSLT